MRQSGRHPAELPLARRAVSLWADLAERLGAPTHYRTLELMASSTPLAMVLGTGVGNLVADPRVRLA